MRYKMDDPEILGKVEALIADMSLKEKIGQLVYIDGADSRNFPLIESEYVGTLANAFGAQNVTRLQRRVAAASPHHIPAINMADVIHGCRTIFPIPPATACSFDPELVERVSAAQAREAEACGVSIIAGPMVDIARDPRWGRIAEGAGEDPYLGGVMAAARVRGIHHTGRIAGCAKHFCAYGAAEGGRDYDTAPVTENQLWNVYLPPFQACVDAGVEGVMVSFNDCLDVPMTANRYLLRDVLRGKMGFDGWIVSDYNAIAELIAHGVARDRREACIKAANAGVQLDIAAKIYPELLEGLAGDGSISAGFVDEACRAILYLKYALGLFENYTYDEEREKSVILCGEHRELARECARRSMVLLKNGGALPLRRGAKLLVAGAMADDPDAPLGWWRCQGDPKDTTTVLQGIREYTDSIDYVKCCELSGGGLDMSEALRKAPEADAIIAVVGEPAKFSGESRSRSDIRLPGRQEEMIAALCETGRPVIVVVVSGRPLDLSGVAGRAGAILMAWQFGVSGGAAGDILFGAYNPTGRLCATFPRDVGQLPIYYGHKNTGRPDTGAGAALRETVASYDTTFTSRYIDLPNSPLYPFGYGLSYTTFSYGAPRLEMGTGEIRVSAVVENTGEVAGEETVQLYIRDVSASVTRPVKELKGFQKVRLAPGERAAVTFTITPQILGYYNQANEFVTEPGEFKVWIAPDSASGEPVGFDLA